jgi:hypothetical protein
MGVGDLPPALAPPSLPRHCPSSWLCRWRALLPPDFMACPEDTVDVPRHQCDVWCRSVVFIVAGVIGMYMAGRTMVADDGGG